MLPEQAATAVLRAVSQHQLYGAGIEIVLSQQARHAIFSHVVVYHGEGNDEGNIALSVGPDDLENLGFFIGR